MDKVRVRWMDGKAEDYECADFEILDESGVVIIKQPLGSEKTARAIPIRNVRDWSWTQP